MKKLYMIMTAAALAITMYGCAGLDRVSESATGELVVQYATLKVIADSDSIDRQDVVDLVDRVSPILADRTDTLAVLMAVVRSQIDWDRLEPADHLAVNYIFNMVERRLAARGMAPAEISTSLLTFLGWIREAALLSPQ